ncbi:hypothetical protein MRS44_016036 [Fusarium solani]|uniref:uncharacterized protein n=1 Tax=Fusarium solani TaxID=169388 RepID=UPI0032C3F2D2|nr:hypothetical protein MRS44_016036 [Fusarium solani]
MPLLGPPGSVVLAVIFILIGVAAFAIAARTYLRLKIQKRRLIMSDFLVIAAWLCACTGASFDIVLVVKGVLKPENDWFLTNLKVDAQTYELLLRIMWGGMIPYYTTFYLCKASLLSIYLQLFPCFMKKRRILLSVTEPEHLCDPAVIATGFRIAWVLHILGSIMQLWGALDAYIGLVVACLPSLRPYFRPNFGTSSYDQSKKPSESGQKDLIRLPKPIPLGPPISQLREPMQQGFRCTFEPSCFYIGSQLRRIREHLRVFHKVKQKGQKGRPSKAAASQPSIATESYWRAGVAYQQLFKQGPRSEYFEVLLESDSSKALSLLEAKAAFEAQALAIRSKEARAIEQLNDFTAPNPWLRRLGSARHLADFSGEKDFLRELLSLDLTLTKESLEETSELDYFFLLWAFEELI